jgi:PAS domain S-box-containing protein
MAVTELSQKALSGLAMPLLMDETLSEASRACDAGLCEIAELSDDRQSLTSRHAVGFKPWGADDPPIALNDYGHAAFAFDSSEPLFIDDLRSETRFKPAPRLVEHGAVSGLCVVIGDRRQPFGTLCVHTTSLRAFSKTDGESLQALAAVLAMALDAARLRERLRNAESLNAAVLSTALDCIIIIDHRGRVVEWNPAAERTFGFSRSEALGRELAELIIPVALRPMHKRGLARYLATGTGPVIGRRIQVTALRHDGSEFPVELAITPNSAQNKTTFTAYLRDLTDQHRSDESQAKLAAIVESTHDAIISKSLDGVIATWNAGAEGLFGYTAGEMIGRPITALIPPDRLDEEAAILERLRRGERIEHYDTVRLAKDGRLLDVSLTISPIKSAAGVIIGASKIARDISERRRIEAQLKEFNEVLEGRVAERTAFAERRTVQMRALAMQLIQAEQEERRRIAHLLHDNLQQVLVATQMRLTMASPPDTKTRSIITQATGLIDESIRMSRSLATQLSPPILQDGGLVGALAWLKRHFFEEHKFTVEIEADPDTPELGEKLKRFLFDSTRELLFNAVKHSGTASAVVRLGPAGEGQVKIVVADRGRGFTTVDALGNALNAHFGLFSIQQRVALLGGSMIIESDEGVGARVTLVVPADPPDPVRSPSPRGEKRSAPRGDPPKDPGGRIRVLLVDDHKIVREGLRSLLAQDDKVEVVGAAADGHEAVDMAMHVRPDVVLMDVTMPRMDGIEATRRICSELPGTRVIGLSMHEHRDMAAAMIGAGAVGYLAKGGPSDALFAAIHAGNTPPPTELKMKR